MGAHIIYQNDRNIFYKLNLKCRAGEGHNREPRRRVNQPLHPPPPQSATRTFPRKVNIITSPPEQIAIPIFTELFAALDLPTVAAVTRVLEALVDPTNVALSASSSSSAGSPMQLQIEHLRRRPSAKGEQNGAGGDVPRPLSSSNRGTADGESAALLSLSSAMAALSERDSIMGGWGEASAVPFPPAPAPPPPALTGPVAVVFFRIGRPRPFFFRRFPGRSSCPLLSCRPPFFVFVFVFSFSPFSVSCRRRRRRLIAFLPRIAARAAQDISSADPNAICNIVDLDDHGRCRDPDSDDDDDGDDGDEGDDGDDGCRSSWN